MKIDYAVISSDDSHYLDYYEVVSKVWNHFGIKTLMLHVTNEESDIEKNNFGLYKKIKAIPDYPTSWQAQLVRLYAYKIMEDEDVCLLMSDIDMLPLNGDYFLSEANNLLTDQVLTYSGQPYGVVPYFPMCYILGNSKVMTRVLNLQDSYENFLSNKKSTYGIEWNTDEHFLYDSISNYSKLCSPRKHTRSFNEDRIDRSSWSYDLDKLKQGFYIDSHMLRPYDSSKEAINRLANYVIDNCVINEKQELKMEDLNRENERLREIDGWKTFDVSLNMMFPWYTRTFLNYLIGLNTKDWKVFEYGGGNSSLWWRQNAREVISIDTDGTWSNQCNLQYVPERLEFISYPTKIVENEKFDCIIIDGEPTQWRDDCTEFALQSIKDGGLLIIDNYKQPTVGLADWYKTDNLLSSYEKKVFAEPNHPDWKTACWIIKK